MLHNDRLRNGALGVWSALALLYLFIPVFIVVLFSFNDNKGRFNFTWEGFTLTYRHRSATYQITVANPQHNERGILEMSLDGEPRPGRWIELLDDGRTHKVHVILGGSKDS